MKDLVKIIEQESYEYRDPITGILAAVSCPGIPLTEEFQVDDASKRAPFGFVLQCIKVLRTCFIMLDAFLFLHDRISKASMGSALTTCHQDC